MEREDGYYKKLYENDKEAGAIFQDFVCETLSKHGIPVSNYGSKIYQLQHGENSQGREIKLDRYRAKTGNLYIERFERSRPYYEYTLGGIYRPCFEYIIGDYQVFYQLPAQVLRDLLECHKYRDVENKVKTSLGTLVPEEDAERIAIRTFRVDPSGEMALILKADNAANDESIKLRTQIIRNARDNPDQPRLFEEPGEIQKTDEDETCSQLSAFSAIRKAK
jgi:hypothetical protein